jgi:hypothetical protein
MGGDCLGRGTPARNIWLAPTPSIEATDAPFTNPPKTGVNFDFSECVSSAMDSRCLRCETRANNVRHVTFAAMRLRGHVIGGAWTAVFQKRGGQWVIVPEHLSDVQSNPNLPMNMNPQGNP